MNNTIPIPAISAGAAATPTITTNADMVEATVTPTVVIDAEVIGDTAPPADSVLDHPSKGGEGGSVGTVSGMDAVEGGGGVENVVDGVVEKQEPEDSEMVEVEGDLPRPLYESSSSSSSNSSPATVFKIRLKQTPSNLTHKMRVPGLCRNFSAVAWCGKLNIISCASETCARIPSSNANPPFWIPIYILNPERPTECAVFNITADSPRDSVQFMEWSPRSFPRALLIANFHGRATIWTQPSQSSPNLVRDENFWECEHEWRQDLAVATKWLSRVTPYRRFPSNSTLSACSKSTLEEKFFCKQPQISGRWPNFLCVCSVFSSGSVQLHWSQWPTPQNGQPKWFSSSKGLLGAGPSGIMAADVIITDAGTMHVAGVPLVNPSTVVVWEVIPGPGNVLQTCAVISTSSVIPTSLNNNCTGIASLAAYLFSWQDYLLSDGKEGKKFTDQDLHESVLLHCSPVSNFSAYVSPELAAQSAATTTWGSGVTAVAFDPTGGGSVISVVIVEGQYMSPYDPDVGPSITGWRVQRWESSLKPVVLHPIFENPSSNVGGQPPMQTVWETKFDKTIPPTDDFRSSQMPIPQVTLDERNSSDSSFEKINRLIFDPYDLPSDVRMLAQIVYSSHGGEVSVAFLRGGVHIFHGQEFIPVDSYQVNVGSTIAAPAFSPTSCCLASVWHDSKDCTTLKIFRVLPPATASAQDKFNSVTWEHAIADRFWWSLLAGVDWWDVVGCTQSASEDGNVLLNSVIGVLDDDFHSLLSTEHRQHHGPNLDRIKCRLLEGTNAQDVRVLVLDMQARLLLDMLGKGIESALVNPATLMPEPWLASGETLSAIDADKMVVDPLLASSIQGYVDAILDLASHFITRLRRYATFCRTLSTHAVTSAGSGSTRNMVASPPLSSASPSNQGGHSSGTNPSGNSQVQAWVQDAIAKISTADGTSSTIPNPTSGPSSSFMPISINTSTFPGTPAVRLIGDCHFLHRLCQMLLFCLIFRRKQSRMIVNSQKPSDSNLPKAQAIAGLKVEESTTASRSSLGDVQTGRPGQLTVGSKGPDNGTAVRSIRVGTGNAGQGYTSDEVKILFLILVDLCKRTAPLPHPFPSSQMGTSNISIRLHYIDGIYTVLPEVVEASLQPHLQIMPRPRGADAAGLLLRELELHPPSEEWHRRNMFGGPWSDSDDLGSSYDPPHTNPYMSSDFDFKSLGGLNSGIFRSQNMWPRKRRFSERDAAFGFKTSVGLGTYLGIMGSRRDVITTLWKTGLQGIWYKCMRCLRQSSAFTEPSASNNLNTNERESWWIGRWTNACPMCGGGWVRVV